MPSSARGEIATTTTNFRDDSVANRNYVLTGNGHRIDYSETLNKIFGVIDFVQPASLLFSGEARKNGRRSRPGCIVAAGAEGAPEARGFTPYEGRMTASDAPNVRHLRRPMHNAAGAARRMTVEWAAELKHGDAVVPCTVVDVSSAGAQLSIAEPPPPSRVVWLMLPKTAPIPATLAWRSEGRVGLRFLREQHWLHRQEAKRFDAAEWVKRG
jgi:PilZ domain